MLESIPSITLNSYTHNINFTEPIVDLNSIYRHLTLSVISNLMLSLSPTEAINNFGRLYLPVMEECNKRVWDPTRRFGVWRGSWFKHVKECRELNEYVKGLVFKR